MKNLIIALAALCIASPVFAGTPTGVLNPDGSITYTFTPNDDVPQHPGPLAAVIVGNTGVGSYQWQALTGPLGVGDDYLIAWDATWNVEMRVQGQTLWDVGGAFYGHHGGTSYSGNPEPVLHFTPSAGSRELSRRERQMFEGSGLVGMDWWFTNSQTVSAWSESTGYVGVGAALNALNVEFQVTYFPAKL